LSPHALVPHISRVLKSNRSRALNLFFAPVSLLTVAPLTVALLTIVLLAIAPAPARAAHLQPATAQAFDRYVQSVEAAGNQEIAKGNDFLWIDALPQSRRAQAYDDLAREKVIVRQCAGCASPNGSGGVPEIPGGLIHDWTGLAFIPGRSLKQTLALLQDYDRDAEYYRPQVFESRLLSRSGDDFHILLRLKQAHGITVVFDAEYDVRYTSLDATRAYSRSYSTKISEVENPEEAGERVLPPGDDRGFLWRMYTEWRFYEANGGTYVQCRAITLTRDIPTGLAWVVRPFIEHIPADSLRFTLESTRNAVLEKTANATP
jgi:hypothetical protein